MATRVVLYTVYRLRYARADGRPWAVLRDGQVISRYKTEAEARAKAWELNGFGRES